MIRPDQVTRYHISEYLSFLAGKGLTGVTRARKLASIREFFKSLVDNGTIPLFPSSFNDAMPPVRVHPLTHEVTINGENIGIGPLSSVPLSRLYIVS